MNQTHTPVSPIPKPATPTSSRFLAGPPSAAQQAKAPETKPQAVQLQAARRTVRFELDTPKASGVFVVGTFNNWKPGVTPLTAVGPGKWAKELALAPGRHEYRFVVDGKWVDDPKAKTHVPNPHGGRNAVVEI